MAKEYVISKAFKSTVSKEDKTLKQWEAHGKKMQVWVVQVEGEPFYFQMNKVVGNEITEGDTLYGLFDEEVNPKTGKSYMKFMPVKRPDGSFDKIQARSGQSAQSEGGSPQNGSQAVSGDIGYLTELLEAIADDINPEIVKTVKAKRFVKEDTLPNDDDIDDKPLDLSEIPF